MNFMETVDAEWAEEQLAAAEAEIEQQKKEWEMERLAIEQADERSKRVDDEPDEEEDVGLTYASEDAKNQVNDISHSKLLLNQRKKKKKRFSRGEGQTNSIQSEKTSSKFLTRSKTATSNKKFRSKLRRRSSVNSNESHLAASERKNSEIRSKLKVEAYRLEHLHLLSDKIPDSHLISKSLAKIKRGP